MLYLGQIVHDTQDDKTIVYFGIYPPKDAGDGEKYQSLVSDGEATYFLPNIYKPENAGRFAIFKLENGTIYPGDFRLPNKPPKKISGEEWDAAAKAVLERVAQMTFERRGTSMVITNLNGQESGLTSPNGFA